MQKSQFDISVDRLARYKYLKDRIDPDNLYEQELMDVTPEEIEAYYKEAGDEIAQNISNSVGKKPFHSVAELKANIETRYQKLLKATNQPDSELLRKELMARAEKEILADKFIDVGDSGVDTPGIVLEGTTDGFSPYGIGGIYP